MKRLVGGMSPRLRLSFCQGWHGVKQDEMMDYIRSTGKSLVYYVIADDNRLEGL